METTKAVLIFVLCLLIMGLWFYNRFVNRPRKEKAFIEKAMKEGTYTNGVLVKNTLRLGNDEAGNSSFKNDKMSCVYEYSVNGVTYKKRIAFQSPGMVSVAFPYSIVIYYDGNNPKKCVWRNKKTKMNEFGR